MSILTLAEIKTEISSTFASRGDINDRLDTVVDLSQLRLARLHDFDELRQKAIVDTVITSDAEADKTISFPALTDARIRKVYSMRLLDTSGTIQARKLRKILTKNWDQKIPEPEFYSRGTPTHYTVFTNNEFELWKVPNIVYRINIRVSRWPKQVAITGEGNAIDLENVDDLIITLSISYLYHSLGRSDKGKEFFGIYRGLAKEALLEDATDYDESMAGIRPGDAFGSTTRGYDDPFIKSIVGGL